MKRSIKKPVGFIAVAAVMSGLLLFGWGFQDAGAFFAHPARAVLFACLIIMCFVGAFIADRSKVDLLRKGERAGRKEVITGIALPTLIWALMLIVPPYSDSHSFLVLEGEAFRILGVIVNVAGSVLCVWGPCHLGRQFSALVTIQEGHELVTNGPFAIMRHPRYSGIALWTFGTALIFSSILGLAGAAVMTALLVYRIRKEENMLHQEFGAAWEGYCRQTPRKLVPFVY